MKLPKLCLWLATGLLATALISGSAGAQGQVRGKPGQAPAGQTPPGSLKITVTGKIAHMEDEGGYYVQGEKPHEIFIIGNQNPEVLDKLVKSGKIVTIEARSMGDILTIEKIDGQEYHGTKAPVFK